jgi:hypothetical protein
VIFSSSRMAELVIEPTALAQCDSHSRAGGELVSIDMFMLQGAGSVAPPAAKIAATIRQARHNNQNDQNDQALTYADAKQHTTSFCLIQA